jgi:hypothetical protein
MQALTGGWMRPLVTAVLLMATLSSFSLAPDNARNTRELNWDTYLDKVQGAWMGKMIGVTFGQPWEFQYQNTPIGFDITDWPLSPTRMKDYRSRAANNPDQENWDPITREADNQKIVILHNFIMASEKELTTRNGKVVLRVPYQDPVAPDTLEQVEWIDDKPVLK